MPAQRQERPDRTRFTSRAAVLAVVICAIALSLAYPVREYIAQRRQIDTLQAQHAMLAAQLRRLQEQQQRLTDPAFVEQLARDRLHMCLRGETCYVIIGGHSGHPASGPATATVSLTPWYARLWQSVQQADHGTSR